ncbi:hypothetical protein [uncultured Thiodictyon sp.]|uniref:hypothetical protein n=1 Tax=uncultured Thiodictyon sp. TaxID=1846217 RepID=UPI0025F4C73B|nr:hypothetical protein [uncultured Thiodictyon sp.]
MFVFADYERDLRPGAGQARAQTGRSLSATAERRRNRASAVPEGDRGLLDSVARPGGVTLPRLRWARRASTAHRNATTWDSCS